jgi:hypothetical protein
LEKSQIFCLTVPLESGAILKKEQSMFENLKQDGIFISIT